MDQFRYNSYAQEIIFGAGSLDHISEVVERMGCRRLMLCANHSMQVNGHISAVENILGERLISVFDRVHSHVQDVQLDEVFSLAVENNIEAIIGMGGGSPIGMAKAVSAALGKDANT